MNPLLVCAWMAAAAQGDSVGSYAQELAAARKAGLPTTPADMRRPAIPPSQNAAPLYAKLAAMLRARPQTNEEDDCIAAISRTTSPTPEQIAQVQTALDSRRRELALIHEIAARPRCQFDRDWSLGPALQFREFSSMRAAARFLAGESFLLLRQGKALEGIRRAAAGFTIAEHANQDNMVIGYLVGIAVDAITVHTLGIILDTAGLEPGVASAVRATIRSARRPLSLVNAMRTETLMQVAAVKLVRGEGLATLSQLTSGDEPKPPSVGKTHHISPSEHRVVEETLDRSGAYMLHKQREMVAAVRQPYPEARLVFDRMEREVDAIKDPRLLLVPVVLPVFANLPATHARHTAAARVLEAAAAVMEWRQLHGVFPDRLEQAVNPAPIDPFDLKPLRYRREGEGFVVYSVGQTGSFTGDARDQKPASRESVFRYPAPVLLAGPKVKP